jgi:hypothetical protein
MSGEGGRGPSIEQRAMVVGVETEAILREAGVRIDQTGLLSDAPDAWERVRPAEELTRELDMTYADFCQTLAGLNRETFRWENVGDDESRQICLEERRQLVAAHPTYATNVHQTAPAKTWAISIQTSRTNKGDIWKTNRTGA